MLVRIGRVCAGLLLYKRNLDCSTYYKSMQSDPEPDQNNTAIFTEGHAKIYTSYTEKNKEGKTVENEVFYNPVQIFNRDFSVLVMQGYIHRLQEEKKEKFAGVTIADCLSASGLRTIRYLKELQGVNTVYANDLLPAAHKLMNDNFALNNLDPARFKTTLQDANVLLREHSFDIVDLDPYGSAVPFLDASVGSVKEGGLLCITCTDTRVLCGPDLNKCFYFYGATRAKVHDFNENALRILLATISSTASRHCRYIEPVISLQTDFYVRVFVRVFNGKRECGESGAKIGNIYNCEFCGNYEYQPFFKLKKNKLVPERSLCSSVNCTICGHPYQLNGPVWLDPINDQGFSLKLQEYLNGENCKLPLSTKKKLNGVLAGIVSEGELAKIPLSFNFDLMNKTVHSVGLSKQALLWAVQSLGENSLICPSYLSPGLYKTNLPFAAIYDVIKAYKLAQMGADKYLSNVTSPYARKILETPATYIPDFAFKTQNKHQHVPRFISMGKGMGPKGKAGKRILPDQAQEAPKQEKAQQIQQQELLGKQKGGKRAKRG